jgi:uncharacterized cupin superfamily protein
MALVLQPDVGESWWQPQPAGGYVREHWHSRQEEILFCFEGEGLFIVDGVEHRAVPGTTDTLAVEKAVGFGPKLGE